jgi:hypothetical protein
MPRLWMLPVRSGGCQCLGSRLGLVPTPATACHCLLQPQQRFRRAKAALQQAIKVGGDRDSARLL